MVDCCPTCHRPFLGPVRNDTDALTLMRAACVMMGIERSWDDHVSERDAARLLRRSAKTLRNRRSLDQPIPFRRRGKRVEYALADLCAWRGDEDPQI